MRIVLAAGLLVLVAGMVPAPGESVDDWWTATGYTDLRHADGYAVRLRGVTTTELAAKPAQNP